MQFSKVHQSPCSVPPPGVVVVVVFSLRALRAVLNAVLAVSQRERSPREREKEKRIFMIEVKAPGDLSV